MKATLFLVLSIAVFTEANLQNGVHQFIESLKLEIPSTIHLPRFVYQVPSFGGDIHISDLSITGLETIGVHITWNHLLPESLILTFENVSISVIHKTNVTSPISDITIESSGMASVTGEKLRLLVTPDFSDFPAIELEELDFNFETFVFYLTGVYFNGEDATKATNDWVTKAIYELRANLVPISDHFKRSINEHLDLLTF